ncbi:MAG: Holliday junction resolvase RuvX [Clostridia bacterium]|nr:Holliday junction resolvase RuvX [Clostridia bacterium]
MKPQGRIVALDVGDVRIGIAVCDETRTIASPHSVYKRVGFGPDVRHIKALCDSFGTHSVLCGLPRNMDGSVGFQAKKVLALAQQLEATGLHVIYQDERLTTVTAERALIEGGMHREERRDHVDKVAAAVILQQYLDTLSHLDDANVIE